MNNISDEGLQLITEAETFVATPYLDHGGNLAVGYGHSTLRKPVVKPDLIWTEPEARAILKDDLAYIGSRLAPRITAQLNDDQFTVCCSLAYNTGIAGFLRSDVLAMINNTEKKYHLLYAAVLMLNYAVSARDKITGVRREFVGLKGRRIDEAWLFKRKSKP
jgi:GH24 family phage-related lysozyme (muramidase)